MLSITERLSELPGGNELARREPQAIYPHPNFQNQTHAGRRLRVSNRRVDLASNLEFRELE